VAPERERRDAIDSALLQQAFRLARRPLPPRINNTLFNARNAGYIDSAGGGDFRLNAVGYNLVEHALGKEGSDDTAARRKPRRRVSSKKGTSRNRRPA
jgi:hypothetical protein